jgi:DNA gyrase subunit B
VAAKQNDYNAQSITVLEGLEAVRKRPGMYIGSTGERGLHHLVQEVVDNAVDEAMAGYATNVVVTLLADGGVRVVDDGRGIPVDLHPVEKRPAVELVLTTLHAGGKFDGESYAVSGGLHGVGVSVVNALSTALEVEILRDGHVWTQRYEDSKPAHPLRKGEPTRRTGTTVTFWADPTIFETTEYNAETIARRLQEMAFLNKGLTISLRDERPGGPGARAHLSLPRWARGLRQAHQPRPRADPPQGDLVRGQGGRPRGRGGHAVEHRLQRVGVHVRQHDQHR